jgi:crotonobetaine/carnitine-CoA ligase
LSTSSSTGEAFETRTHDAVVHSRLLRDKAVATPDATFLHFPDFGDLRWTFADGQRVAEAVARGLLGAGLRPGDVLGLLFESGPAYVSALLGCWRLGVVPLPLNDAYRGSILRHACSATAPVTLLTSADRVDVTGEAVPHLDVIVVDPDDPAGVVDALAPGAVSAAELSAFDYPRLWESYAILMTSGTTGLSKAVLSPFGQPHAMLEHAYLKMLNADDVMLIDAPLFHVSGLMGLYMALHAGCTTAIYRKFSASAYWDRARECGATALHLLPAMLDFVWKQPPTERDREHSVRLFMSANLSYVRDWQDRFGISEWFTLYSTSETSSPIISRINPDRNNRAIGPARPGVQLRVVDEHDQDVGTGTPGELIIRNDLPWQAFTEYVGDPARTAAAWRNGWFHTGDVFVRDAAGEFHIVDRLTDSIRRRGENISSQEVESEIILFPSVAECAVVAAPGPSDGEEEVRALVVLSSKTEFDASALLSFLAPRLPAFMLPRYVDVVDELPRSSSMKVMKHELRSLPLSTSTYDRSTR